MTHLPAQRDLFAFGEFVDRLAEHFAVIRYDKPGCGLSDRTSTHLSFAAQVSAALAVADAARAKNLIMFGASQGGQIAAAIAARHPERVRALVVYGTCANGRELAPAEATNPLPRGLIRTNPMPGSLDAGRVCAPGSRVHGESAVPQLPARRSAPARS